MERSKKNRIIIIAIFLLVLCVAIAGVALTSIKERTSADSNAKVSIEQQSESVVMEGEQSDRSNLDIGSNQEEANDKESVGKQGDLDNSENEDTLEIDARELANKEAAEGGLKNSKTSGKKSSGGSGLALGKYVIGSQQNVDEPAVVERANDADDNQETETKVPNSDNKDDYVAPKTDINLSDKIETNSEGDILFPFVSYE